MTLTDEQRLTLVLTLVVTAAILIWDYILLKDGVPGNTISSALKSASACLPIPIVFGIWMAHSWWYWQGTETYRAERLFGFLAIVLGSWLWWELSDDSIRTWLSDHPAVTFQAGFVAGHFVWPQYSGMVGA